ncbi:MAG TPA: hypothetical protein DIW86_04095, partial [Pseudomonas sp.]|nr:hypothetical protein [Pseudomonas sp.]
MSKKWQEEFDALRSIIDSSGLKEEVKWGQPCFTLDGRNIVLIHGFKEYCALLFFKGALMKDPKHLLIQQTENVQAARQIRFTGLAEIEHQEKTLKAYIKDAIALEQSGAKVEKKTTAEFPFPEELERKMDDLPALRTALDAPQVSTNLVNANLLLKDVAAQAGVEVMYLMDTTGKTLAASNWDKQDSFVGRNFSFRPYFSEAMAGRLGRFFGLGTTSAKRGYFFAAAVRDGDTIIGVLVVKVDLDHTESLWGNTPEQLLVTDHNGVVILTSRPQWRFRATRPLTTEERQAIIAIQPYPTRDPQPLALSNTAWLRQSTAIAETGWNVEILAPRSLISRPVRTVVAVGGATLLVLMLLLGLMMQRRRHYLERIAFEAKARRELEMRVVERTSDLEGLNRRLKQEVLEREHAQQELVRAQDDLVQAGKLSALGTMSASISHELNQPLAAIRSYAENAEILLDHERTSDARGNLKLISELTGRMASIIAHLRAFARRDRHAPESVALQPALDDALALLAKRRRSMEVELIRDLPEATLW